MPRFISLVLLVAASACLAEETKDVAPNHETQTAHDAEYAKTLSGMSILGNEEAPKSLVIVPWKSSEIGDAISLTDTLDERARPVDKEVFLRELNFYNIRAGE